MLNPRIIRSLFHTTKWHNHSSLPDLNQTVPHVPVMCNEVVRLLNPQPNEVFLDMTFGAGGHTQAMLDANPSLQCFAMDRDPEFLKHVERLRGKTNCHLIPMLGPFSQLPVLGETHGFHPNTVDMILMDLGVSSMQLDDPHRGFGFRHSSRLDMRMDGVVSENITAEEVLNTLEPADLARIFKCYGEERYARRIANAIFEHRHTLGPVRTAKQLSDIINSVVPRPSDRSTSSTNPSTRVFQALRIFINDELNELCAGLELAERLLRSPGQSPTGQGGRLVVISFHSLEDRLVKWALSNTAELIANQTDNQLSLAKQLANRTEKNAVGLHRRQQLLSQLAPEKSCEEQSRLRWKIVSAT
ncbi:unnamed protein product [Echinostoma caproni]|uniref:Methyltransferase-like protein 15 n=1 Tax=Echinostoma caproni TaxID=27848 RepID=A0A183AYE0_9TREM|nr:unnamed protein product [Echinostoma caproni]